MNAIISRTPSRTTLETWAVRVLLATVFGALVIMVPSTVAVPLATKTYALAIGTVITLALYIVARLSRGTVVLPPLVLVGALWLPVVAYLASGLFAGIPFQNALWGRVLEVDTLGMMSVIAMLGTLTALLLRRGEHYSLFFKVGCLAYAGVVAVQLVVLVLGQAIPEKIDPAFSLLGTYENLAMFLGLGVILSLLALRTVELTVRAQRLITVTTVGALILIALANMSFVWWALALVAMGLFVEGVLLRSKPVDDTDLEDVALVQEAPVEPEHGSKSVLPALAVLAVAAFFLLGSQFGAALANALNVNVLSVSPSWQSTLAITKQTYSTAPVFGTGPGTFGAVWLTHRDPSLNDTVFWNTDFTSGVGVIPTSFVTTGLLGIAGWVLLLGLFFGLGLRTLIVRTPQDQGVRTTAVLAFVAATYLFAAAFFRLPNAVLLALAFVHAGLFASTLRFAPLARSRGIVFAQSPRLGFAIVFSLTLVLFGVIGVAYSLVGNYVSKVALAQARTAFNAGMNEDAQGALARSLAFAPSALAYQAQANVALVQLNNIAASTTMPAEEAQQAFQETLSGGINAALTATRLEPNNYQHWMTLGNLYAQAVPLGVADAYESAKTAYDKAQVLHPTSPVIRLTLAQLSVANRDLDSAREHLKAAVELKRDYLAAIFLLSQVEVQSGNVREALDSALSAAYFAPRDPNVQFQLGILRAATQDYVRAAEALEAAVSANEQFANARYFLAAVYARQSQFEQAAAQLEQVAQFSEENATVVTPMIEELEKGRNPFPTNLLTLDTATVQEPPAAQ